MLPFASPLGGLKNVMPDLGTKHTCYSCQTKFYDLGKAKPICPKCGADQNDGENELLARRGTRKKASRKKKAKPKAVKSDGDDDKKKKK